MLRAVITIPDDCAGKTIAERDGRILLGRVKPKAHVDIHRDRSYEPGHDLLLGQGV